MLVKNLNFQPVKTSLDLVSEPTRKSIETNKLRDILVAEIDPSVSDTAAFCEKYQMSPEMAVNCVIVEAKRADKVWYAACMIPATKRADVNGIIRRELGAKKISFAPMETATKLTNMEFGAINPIGLPPDWPILIDANAAKLDHTIIGSGIRKSKLLVTGKLLASLPNAKVLELSKT